MPSDHSINIELKHSTTLSYNGIPEILSDISGNSSSLIIDEIVYNLLKDIYPFPDVSQILLLTAGENHKSFDTVTNICDFLLCRHVSRHNTVYVIGGGSVTDVAAFAVSVYKRGCRLVLIPSTLLGMIDAAIGGKTAINYKSAKNLIGSLYPAEQVVICPDLLPTLPDKEIRNGLAEMLKLRFILPALPEPLSAPKSLPDLSIILKYAKAKLEICANDPQDLKSRRLLNLGHTFGHILESYTNFTIPHGEAIIWGISTAARISHKLNLIDQAYLHQVIGEINKYGFMTELDSDLKSGFISAFPGLAKHDKKGNDSKLTLVLFAQDKQVIIREDIPLHIILSVLPDCL